MKHIKLLNITLLGTSLLFLGCSNSQEKIQKQVSVYNIIGVTEPIQTTNRVQQKRKSQPYIPLVSPDITYISYKKSIPFHRNHIDHRQLKVQQIESRAKSFLGTPYVWGATGPNKFDCSGFTQWVYRDAGINIPRVSKNQARVGEFIKYQNLQPGDMVFFDTKKKRTGMVNHVGIYLGNGNFIHASSKGKGVVIYNFNQKTFYKKRFLWGRRVVQPTLHYSLN
ncbi:MAG TPA: peptidoglycan endopeptidase [Campylobacterales bacterium]|nr:peptidoglycan endopeptidase [Campylobacterales bacterium]HHS92691.1 peptidoglycan endopeptidase [Campylobacterales bacterium]